MTKLLKKSVFINNLISIHEKSKIPFMIINKGRIILAVNSAFIKKFSADKKDLIGGKVDFFFIRKENNDNKQVTYSEIHLPEIIKGDQVFSYYNKAKEENFFFISTFEVPDKDGEICYYSIVKEITDLQEKLMEESVRALVTASQLKDNDTGNHIKRVNGYSYVTAKHLAKTRKEKYPEINKNFIERIFKVASLHDVGKIGTPDYIITKPGKLTDEEFQVMKEHTINGAFILSKMAGQMARDIALFHHEKWDGSGYPYQLKEDQIPLSARIVALVDNYDALRMKRHYKPSFSHEKTKEILIEKKGNHLDPELVDCFLEIESQFIDIYESMKDKEEADSFHPHY